MSRVPQHPIRLAHWLGDRRFCLFLFVCAFCLYSNTFSGGYVWDDRAAIIANKDVHGTNPIMELFQNDFWGQNIKLFDSHKSYRPVTVLSFRLNHAIHGLDAAGFHVVNAVIYSFVCVIFYVWSLQWSSTSVARAASLLFCFHPVHVEAVASLVGRADSLCGLFYLLSLVFYTDGLRGGNHVAAIVGVSLSYLFALCACFSKEIGATVFGVLIFLELAEVAASILPLNAQESILVAVLKKDNKKRDSTKYSSSFLHIWGRILYKCVTSWSTLLRLATSAMGLALIMAIRLRINGTHSLYKWTVLENHVNLLPTFKERLLSYSQTHFWYIFKMIFPRYLCFDYGFSCIPTIHAYQDLRNVLPLSTYAAIVCLIVFAFVSMRLTYLVGLLLLLMPLIPALNILFPVGTVLAERLMFIPSIGFSLIVAELLLNDCAHIWMRLSDSVRELQIRFDESAARSNSTSTRKLAVQHAQSQASSQVSGDKLQCASSTDSSESHPSSSVSTKSKTNSHSKNNSNGMGSATSSSRSAGNGAGTAAKARAYKPVSTASKFLALFVDLNMSLIFLLPVLVLFALRVISRNNDWNSEIQIYKSALEVCPLSVKALTNYASLVLAEGRKEESVLVAETAVALYIGQRGAYVNLGIAYDRSDMAMKGIRVFEKALQLYPNESKIFGYLGTSLFRWASSPVHRLPINDTISAEASHAAYLQVASALRKRAAEYLDVAISRGFDAPAILHTRGSLAIDDNQNNAAAFFLNLAIQKMEYVRRMSPDVPVSDAIDVALTYNQLGSALFNANRLQDAQAAFERGLALSPKNHALRTNLGSFYRHIKRNDLARRVMQQGIDDGAPAALLNNLGLLELDEGNFSAAITLLEQAAAQLTRISGASAIAEMRAPDGGDVVALIQNNIARARQGMINQAK